MEEAWDKTNLEVENYIKGQSAEGGKVGIHKSNKCSGDLRVRSWSHRRDDGPPHWLLYPQCC